MRSLKKLKIGGMNRAPGADLAEYGIAQEQRTADDLTFAVMPWAYKPLHL